MLEYYRRLDFLFTSAKEKTVQPQALRRMALVQDELPKYLLATLWNTGARINEALALTRSDFSLAPPYPFVQLATLKQRAEKAARTAGRSPAGSQAHRLVQISDASYVSQLEITVATLKIHLERRNKLNGRTEKTRIREITDRTVRTWINEAVSLRCIRRCLFSMSQQGTRYSFRC